MNKTTQQAIETCPQKYLHTHDEIQLKLGYNGWCDWAEKMSKTHKQRRCPGCDRYVIWEKKKAR